ncbi:MAG: zinc ribbon domain-containing protein [Oscillospiraceae bacterium]|nr:zinc ribbon domain-containing protein [Oscillospiraceae bacterium]
MAKFCMSCGRQLDEAAKFCASCGAQQTQAQQPAQPPPYIQPQYQPPYAPMPKQKSKMPLVVGGIVGVLAIVFLVVLIATHTFGSGGDNPNNGMTKPTGDDAVSMNALVGLWHTSGFIEDYYWSFGADGRFAYYVSAYDTGVGVNMGYASESYYKGNYRVKGDTIELYNCQGDSFFEYISDFKYFKNRDFSGDIFLDTPLQKSEKVDDFTVIFEFKNASRLRIVIDRGDLRDNYDRFFDYVGTRDDIEIPSHSIAGSAWPKDELPPDLPEYTVGRIMSTETSSQYYLNIKIDGSTREDYIGYVESMVQAGWEWYSSSTESEFEEFRRGEDFRNASTFNKGAYQVTVSYSVNELNQAEIIWWK